MNVNSALCGHPAAFVSEEFRCETCGRYQMPFELQVDRDIKGIGDRVLKVALSAATKQENFFYGRILKLTLENYLSLAETHRWTSVSRKFQLVLEVGRKRSKHFGDN